MGDEPSNEPLLPPGRDAIRLTTRERDLLLTEARRATAPHLEAFQRAEQDFQRVRAEAEAAQRRAHANNDHSYETAHSYDERYNAAANALSAARAPIEAAVQGVMDNIGLTRAAQEGGHIIGSRQEYERDSHNYHMREHLIHCATHQHLREASTLTPEENARIYTQVLAAAGPDAIRNLQQVSRGYNEFMDEYNRASFRLRSGMTRELTHWTVDLREAERPVFEAAQRVFERNGIDPAMCIAPADPNDAAWNHAAVPAQNNEMISDIVSALANPPSQQRQNIVPQVPMTPTDGTARQQGNTPGGRP